MFVTLLHALGLSRKNPPPHRRPTPRRTILTLEPLEDRRVPAAFTVTTLADDPNVPIQGDVTLRDAITGANASNDASSTITFQAGVSGSLQLQAALPALNKNITITGPTDGQSYINVEGSYSQPNVFRVFQVNAGTTCEIDDLTISDGYVNGDGGGILNMGNLTLTNDDLTDNEAAGNFGDGGAIYNGAGADLTLSNSTIGQNTAAEGGGIFNQGILSVCCDSLIYSNFAKLGGGLFNVQSGSNPATATIQDGSQINANNATQDGGGVYVSSGNVSMSGGTVYNNQAEGKGGGLYVYAGSVTLAGGVTIQQNSADTGGGLYLNALSTTTFNGCTISGNQVTGLGKGYYEQDGATINPLSINNQDGFNRGP